MPVRVDQKSHRVIGDRSYCCFNFFCERCKLIIHQKGSVGTYGQPDIAATTDQHVEAVTNGNRLDLHLCELILWGGLK